MDKLLKEVPGFAKMPFIYQKETLEKKLKISDLDINEDTLNKYIFFRLAEMAGCEEVITTGSLSLHLFYLIVFTQVEAELDHHPTTDRQKRLDTIFDTLKKDIAKDALSQKEITDAISKQCNDIEMKHIQEYVKKKKYIITAIKRNKTSLIEVT